MKFLFVFACLCISSTQSTRVAFLKNLKDKQLSRHAIYTKQSLTERQCLFECSQIDKCASINHHAAEMICVVNKEVADSGRDYVITATGWKYMEKHKEKVS